MKKRLGIFVVLIAVLVFGISAQGAFASKEHYFGKTPRGQKIYYTVKSVKKTYNTKVCFQAFKIRLEKIR